MPREFIIRGKTANAGEEVINMTGYRPGYGYNLIDFRIWPAYPHNSLDLVASVTADNVAADPTLPDFNQEGLIGTATWENHADTGDVGFTASLVNDLFVITQDLRLSCRDADSSLDVNWQMRFKEVKLSGPAEAVANYKQYTIYNG